MDKVEQFQDFKRLVLNEIDQALSPVDPFEVETLVDAILSAHRVFVVAVGRVFLVMQAFAKRLTHLGIKVDPVGSITEHPITRRDLLIAASGSGETMFPVGIAKLAKKFHAKVALITASPRSTLMDLCDLSVRIPCPTKLKLQGEATSIQPLTTLFDQSLLILCDCISMIIIKRRKIGREDLWRYHANLE